VPEEGDPLRESRVHGLILVHKGLRLTLDCLVPVEGDDPLRESAPDALALAPFSLPFGDWPAKLSRPAKATLCLPLIFFLIFFFFL
jgi:hypothetical protein